MVENEPVINMHGVVVDSAKWDITIEGQPVRLTKSEFLLLRFLAGRAGLVYTRRQIVDAIHGPAYPVTERSVDVLVTTLRRRLGNQKWLIETVRGVGYRFRA
jgi:two-component system phosphate regulon response regulator PhoB